MKEVNWTPGEVPLGSPAAMVPDAEGLIERLADLEDDASSLASDLKEVQIKLRTYTHVMS